MRLSASIAFALSLAALPAQAREAEDGLGHQVTLDREGPRAQDSKQPLQ